MMGDPAATARLLRERARSTGLWLPVSGTSMGPRYPSGARVWVRFAGRPPRRGQVWAFCRQDGAVLVHRYLARRGGRLIFAGDAVPRADAPVPPDWLVGLVIVLRDGTRSRLPRPRHAIVPLGRAAVRYGWRILQRIVHRL